MLNRAGDADRDVQLQAHLSPGLADLIAVRTPAVVGHGTRRTHGSVAECRGEILDELEILSRFEPAPAGDDHRRLAEIDLPPHPR